METNELYQLIGSLGIEAVVLIIGTYFAVKNSIKNLEEKVEKLETELRETNLGVLKAEIENIKKSIDQLWEKTNN